MGTRKPTVEAPAVDEAGTGDPVDQTDALKAEAAAEQPATADPDQLPEPDQADRPEGALRFVLRRQPLITKPLREWPNSTFEDLETARYAAWARKVLLPESLVLWRQMDASIGECMEALGSWVRHVLGDPGK